MKSLTLLLLLAVAPLSLPACTIAPETPAEAARLRQDSEALLARLPSEHSDFAERVRRAQACAVFPGVGRGGALVGLAYGRGLLYWRGEVVGHCDLSQGSLGLLLGGEHYSEIFCFDTPEALARFRGGVYTLNAQAMAVALTAGASTQGRYGEGVSLLILDEAGLMAEASFGVQELRFEGFETGPFGDEPEPWGG